METRMRKGFFSPRRFGQQLLRDFAGGYRGMLIAMAAVAGTVIVLSALTTLGISQGDGMTVGGAGTFHLGFFVQLLFFGGFIVTSLAFREARQNGAGIFYMTLPASPFEKLASKLVVTSVGFALGSLVFYTATAAVSEGINRLIFGAGHPMFNPFDSTVLRAVGLYLITQSVYLLGSLWFRKLAFVKTVLWITIFAVGFALVAGIAARILLAAHFAPSAVQLPGVKIFGDSLTLSNEFLQGAFGPGTRGYEGLLRFTLAAKILFYGALAPVCWLASYYKLREIEV